MGPDTVQLMPRVEEDITLSNNEDETGEAAPGAAQYILLTGFNKAVNSTLASDDVLEGRCKFFECVLYLI